MPLAMIARAFMKLGYSPTNKVAVPFSMYNTAQPGMQQTAVTRMACCYYCWRHTDVISRALLACSDASWRHSAVNHEHHLTRRAQKNAENYEEGETGFVRVLRVSASTAPVFSRYVLNSSFSWA